MLIAVKLATKQMRRFSTLHIWVRN